MSFKTIKVTKKKKYKNFNNKNLKVFLTYGILWFFWIILLSWILIYVNIVSKLPDVKKLENLNIIQSSTIYDKNWWVLYNLYWDEKRTYIWFDKISKNMVNAIISWEDKRFWDNPGFDIIWLLRAFYYWILWKNTWFAWTSTLTQQLIRNTIIENRNSSETFVDKLERKLKEYVLAYKLTNEVSKEKILELYLNKIAYWSNAFWIEQASLTFFWKSAKDLDILESSILASLPKWPTYYSPYTQYQRLVWNIYSYPKSDKNSITNLITKKALDEKKDYYLTFSNFIKNLTAKRLWENWLLVCNLDKKYFKNSISIDKDGCSILNYSDLLNFLNSLRFDINWEYIEYQTWRKDFILWRMLEDEYITFDDYKKALNESIWLEFNEYKENIKYPHFVMYVKDYLSNKYWEEILNSGWLKIYTTIDPKLQDKAMEIVSNQVSSNIKKFDANNWSLISIDNKTWDILAYVWWENYFNKEIDWNVDMITSKRQPWSSFKPYVYALAIDKNPFWPYTPIYDIKTTFPGGYEPKNYEWKFDWKMNLMTALNGSRNIPAIKLYFLAWEQKGIIDYLKTTWVKSLNENFTYWAPLALWSWEMTALEMAQAYSVFPNNWQKIDINPILKILDSKWLVIEQKRPTLWTKVLNETTAYIMDYIMSNSASRPTEFWNTNLTLKNRPAWAKTWTSNKLFIKNWKKEYFPGDIWTAWFTPQITTVVWAWNTDWTKLLPAADWLNWAAPMWKQFMEYAHSWLKVEEFSKPKWLKSAKISKISWLLAPEWFEPSLTVNSYFTNVPTKYDQSMQKIEVDAMCNWKVWPNTPPSAIKTWYYIAYHSIDPDNKVWESWVQAWAKQSWYKEFWNIWNIISDYKDEECIRDEKLVSKSNIEIATKIQDWDNFINWYNYVEIWYKSANPIVKLQIFLWDTLIQDIKVANKTSWVYAWNIEIPKWYDWNYNLTIKALDSVYLSWEKNYNITISLKDEVPPKINITNPESLSISLYKWQPFNLRWNIEDAWKLRSTNIYIDNNPYKIWIEQREFVEEIKTDNLEVWTHTIKIESIDLSFNKWTKEVTLEVMP